MKTEESRAPELKHETIDKTPARGKLRFFFQFDIFRKFERFKMMKYECNTLSFVNCFEAREQLLALN